MEFKLTHDAYEKSKQAVKAFHIRAMMGFKPMTLSQSIVKLMKNQSSKPSTLKAMMGFKPMTLSQNIVKLNMKNKSSYLSLQHSGYDGKETQDAITKYFQA